MTSLLETNKRQIICEFQTIQDNDLLVFTQPYTPEIFQQECFLSIPPPLFHLCMKAAQMTQRVESFECSLDHFGQCLGKVSEVFEKALLKFYDNQKNPEEDSLAGCFEPHLSRSCGLAPFEATTLLHKTIGIAFEWFQSTALRINDQSKIQITLSDREPGKIPVEYRIRMTNFFYQKLGMKQSKDPIAYSSEELALFGVQAKEVTQEASKMSCMHFAFLKTGELRAKELIFFGKRLPMKDSIHQLIEWGYESALFPIKNDTVIYFDDTLDTPTHFARYLENGLVESKLGLVNPYSHQHHLFNVGPGYGKRVVFMRKTSIK